MSLDSDVDNAVARLIPQVVALPADSDSGTRDSESSQSQVLQLVLSALLSDPGAVYGLAYMVAQRARLKAAAVVSTLDALVDAGALYALTNDPWQEPSSWSDMSKALKALHQLRAQLGRGRYSTETVGAFTSAVDTLMTDVVVPALASGGTRTQAEANVRALMETLRVQWAEYLAARQYAINCLGSYDESVVRVRYAHMVANNALYRLADVNNALATATSEARGAQMSSVAVDLAVVRTAVSQTLDLTGAEAQIGLSLRDDGYTEPEYRVLQGEGSLTPSLAVFVSNAGRIDLDVLAHGTNGVLSDFGGEVTNQFSVAGVSDHTLMFSAGQYLTIPDIGLHSRITYVEAAGVRFQPNITLPENPTGLRWVLTQSRIGSLLGDSETALVTTRSTGRTASTAVLEGSGGTFVREVRASGSGASSHIQSGPDGVTKPYVAEGTTGTTDGTTTFTDAGATFLSDGVQPGDTIVIDGVSKGVDSIESETSLTLSSTMTAGINRDWFVVVSDATVYFHSPSASFFGVGAAVGWVVLMTYPPSVAGAYRIVDVIDDQTVQVLPASSPYTAGSTPLPHETGVDWYLYTGPDIAVLPDDAYLTSVAIAEGDTFDVGADSYAVVEVVNATRLQIDPSWVDLDTPVTDEDWAIYRGDGSTRIFEQSDFSFSEEGVTSLDVAEGRLRLWVDGVWYDVEEIVSDHQLRLSSDVALSSAGLSWRLVAADSTNVFEDPDNSLSSYQRIRVFPGEAGQQDLNVVSVDTPHRVVLDGRLPEAQSNITYQVFGQVQPGMVVLAHGFRTSITDVTLQGSLVVDPPFPLGVAKEFPYRVVANGVPLQSSRLMDASQASGDNFSSDWIGYSVDLNFQGRQVTSEVLAVTDQDGDGHNDTLVVAHRHPMDGRQVAYTLRKEIAGKTSKFFAPQAPPTPEGAWLAIWGDPQAYLILDSTPAAGEVDFFLEVEPLLDSGLSDVRHCVGRAESFSALHWDMFRRLVDQSTPDLRQDTSILRGLVAEAIFVPTTQAVESAVSEVGLLRLHAAQFVSLVDALQVQRSEATQQIIDLLASHRYDYALDLLLRGDFGGFLDLLGVSGGYASRARVAAQDAAKTLSFESSNEVGGALTSTLVYDLPDATQAQIALARSVASLTAEERSQTAASTTLDDVRNQALYLLAGEATNYTPDAQSPLLPWVTETGTLRDRVVTRADRAIAAIQALIDAG